MLPHLITVTGNIFFHLKIWEYLYLKHRITKSCKIGLKKFWPISHRLWIGKTKQISFRLSTVLRCVKRNKDKCGRNGWGWWYCSRFLTFLWQFLIPPNISQHHGLWKFSPRCFRSAQKCASSALKTFKSKPKSVYGLSKVTCPCEAKEEWLYCPFSSTPVEAQPSAQRN